MSVEPSERIACDWIDYVTSVVVHPTQDILFVGTKDQVFVWYRNKRKLRALDAHKQADYSGWRSIREIAVHPDGNKVASIYSKGELIVWDLDGCQPIRTLTLSEDEVSGRVDLLWSDDGKDIRFSNRSGIINVHDIFDKEIEKEKMDIENMSSLRFSPCRKEALVLHENGDTALIDIESGDIKTEFGMEDWEIENVRWNPQGTLVAMVHTQGTIGVWSTEDGQPLMKSYRGDSKRLHISWSPNGRYLLASSSAAKGRYSLPLLWDLATGLQHQVANPDFTLRKRMDRELQRKKGGRKALWWNDGTEFLVFSEGNLLFYKLDDLPFPSEPVNHVKRFLNEIDKKDSASLDDIDVLEHLESALTNLPYWTTKPEADAFLKKVREILAKNKHPKIPIFDLIGVTEYTWLEPLNEDPALRANERVVHEIIKFWKFVPEYENWDILTLLYHQEWRENESLLNLVASIIDEIGIWFLYEAENYSEIVDSEIVIDAIAKSIVENEECVYEEMHMINLHEPLRNSEKITDAFLAISDRLYDTLNDFWNICEKLDGTGLTFWDLLAEIKNLDQLMEYDTIQNILYSFAPTVAEHLIGLHGSMGRHYIGEALEIIWDIPSVITHFDVQLAVLHLMKIWTWNRLQFNFGEKTLENNRMMNSFLIQIGFSQIDEEYSVPEPEYIETHMKQLKRGIRKSRIPWIAATEVFDIDDIMSDESVVNELKARYNDIAEVIRETRYALNIALDIYRNPLLMKSESVRAALEDRQKDILGFVLWDSIESESLFRSVIKNELDFDDLISIQGQILRKDTRTLRVKQLSGGNLSKVEELNELERVQMEDVGLTSIDLSYFEECEKLEWLKLSGNKLTSVDLEPLSSLSNLSVLEFADNDLTDIDLSPLSGTNIRTLVLSGNSLSEIDLSPLSETPVKHLILSRNNLNSIDLSSLSKCPITILDLNHNILKSIDLSVLQRHELEQLYLGSNNLTSINWSHLENQEELQELDLSGNQIESFELGHMAKFRCIAWINLTDNPIPFVDVTPVTEAWYPRGLVVSQEFNPQKRQSDYGPPVLLQLSPTTRAIIDSRILDNLEPRRYYNEEGFDEARLEAVPGAEISRIIVQKSGWKKLRERFDGLSIPIAVSTLGMPEFSGLQADSVSLLEGIPPSVNFEEGQAIAYDNAIELLEKQIENNGSTLNFEIDCMKNTGAAVLIPALIELRKREVESIQLEFSSGNDKVNLEELRNTYYGREVLSSLDISYRATLEEIKQIQAVFDETGINLNDPIRIGSDNDAPKEVMSKHDTQSHGNQKQATRRDNVKNWEKEYIRVKVESELNTYNIEDWLKLTQSIDVFNDTKGTRKAWFNKHRNYMETAREIVGFVEGWTDRLRDDQILYPLRKGAIRETVVEVVQDAQKERGIEEGTLDVIKAAAIKTLVEFADEPKRLEEDSHKKREELGNMSKRRSDSSEDSTYQTKIFDGE
ncbi:MAG: leucine-rich repeat protein [Candidatus Lokiarchaeota archaeon]|nr:leucine-rich repeat protein [Candidatus Lokiarchaeota archaeon]